MSVPPLVDLSTMPTMVSRLPKFGSRPRSQTAPAAASGGATSAAAGSTCLPNGFYHHPGPVGVNGTASSSSAKQNGFIRVPNSFSARRRRANEAANDGGMDREAEWRRGKPHFSPVLSKQDATKATSAGRRPGQPSSSSSSPSPQSSPRTLPVPKTGPLAKKGNQTTSGLTLNMSSGSKPQTKAISSLRQPQSFAHAAGSRPGSGPGSRSGSPLYKKAAASRSYSSETLGCVSSIRLTENDRLRSRSLTQVRQQPSPTITSSSSSSSPLTYSPIVTRSYSTNRAAQRGTPGSSPQAPPRGSLLKPPGNRQTGRNVKGQSCSASGWQRVGTVSQLSQSTLKKPLLPGPSPASRSSGISYKLSRPSLIKQPRPLRVTPANLCGGDQEVNRGPNRRRNSVETPSSTENSPAENSPEAADGLSVDTVSQEGGSIAGEMLEDMSLSSTSSLDRNDTSQEYMDDFDNLGNRGVGILLFSSKNDEEDSGLDQSCTRLDDKEALSRVTKATGLCFLDDGLYWTGVRGEKEEDRLNRVSQRRRSSQPDYHEQGGSSLDLSPSDSCGSGGTYMWDEEGLEPLGGAATTASIHTNSNTTHHIRSFDSDINSIDLLNNLESCDLADDDLMLDADFPDDSSLHSDGDGLSHMAQWRKRQLCWETQDLSNDNEGELPQDPEKNRDRDIILDSGPARSACLPPAAPGLGLDVEELAEDCSLVRSQLEFLQRLLLQEEDVDEDTLTTETLSPESHDSPPSSDSQVQALLQEVQQLREELRSRDRTIAQLSLQLTVPTLTTRCRCQEATERTDRHTQTGVTTSESVASQTPWKEHVAFPPVPFLSPPWQYQRSRPYRSRPKPSIPSHLARRRVEHLVLYFTDSARHRYFTPPARETRSH
ncbi:serine-rich coiled-coil domain-containing protein 2 isoform X1 [Kryptolebias marmoratus]|uniref:serine-rich coiled-coil domain-containing protein 2 isoform X1 n=1 Tax=Kryptolebias marmoratus TaxID=37003 RepID=UPI0007F8CF71|nr:serine-rich coiled-coil domain-containing protein 2 isoform X1 [Kryptolebias marmoratus]